MTYEATYTDHDGATISGPRWAVDAWRQSELTYTQRERVWVDEMRTLGVKGTHPDDGWVDRKNDSVRFCYPQMDRSPEVGDLIALGNHEQHRLVRVTAVEPPSVLARLLSERSGTKPQPRYFFTDVSS